jgi:hypothetical protein
VSEDRDKAKQGSLAATWAVGLVAALVLYVLSVPFAWTYVMGPYGSDAASKVTSVIYKPLCCLEGTPTWGALYKLWDWEGRFFGFTR